MKIKNIRNKTDDLIMRGPFTEYMGIAEKNGTVVEEYAVEKYLLFTQVVNTIPFEYGGGSILVEIGDNGSLVGYSQRTVIVDQSTPSPIINASEGLESLKACGVVINGEKPDMRVMQVALVYAYDPWEYGNNLILRWRYTLIPTTGGNTKRAYIDAATGEIEEIV